VEQGDLGLAIFVWLFVLATIGFPRRGDVQD
jgi:hypothetical protein